MAGPTSKSQGRLCGAPKTGRSDAGEGPCRLPAGYGTNHMGFGACKYHYGATKTGVIHAVKEEVAYKQQFYGTPEHIEPTDALLGEVRRSAGHVAWLGQQIASLGDTDNPMKTLTTVSEKGREIAAWVKVYGDERDRLARVAKMALDAGVAERNVRLAEKQGEMIAIALRGILKDLGLSDAQEAAAPQIVARHLRAVS